MTSVPAPIVVQAQEDTAGEATAGVGFNPATPEVAIFHVGHALDASFNPKGLSQVVLKRTAVALLTDLTQPKWVAARE